MVAGYGRGYRERYRAIADLIPQRSTVLDVCCGPGILYQRYLRQKSVVYTGLDINEKFVRRVIGYGGAGEVCDLRSERPLPPADYVVMQASLYHFLPDPTAIISRMLAAARTALIVAEPVRNLTHSRSRPVRWLARSITDPGVGIQPYRFNRQQ